MSATSPSGLTVSPFTDNPDDPVFVETEAHRRAVAQARFGIAQGSGLVVITGEPGSGKTAVLDRTAFLTAAENSALVRLSANEIESESLEVVVLRVLQVSEPGIDPESSLEEALQFCRVGGVTPALLIDDADDLGDEGLVALQHIAELQKDGDPLFRIVIAGRPALRSVFYRDDMAAVRKLVSATHQLGALSRDEVSEYVDARVRAAGFTGEIVPTVEFLNELSDQSGGNPGRINKLAIRAIAKAGVAGRSELLSTDLSETAGGISGPKTDDIEDADVIEAKSANEVAASLSCSGKASFDERQTLKRKGPVTVTDLNAAIEQLSRSSGAKSVEAEQKPAPEMKFPSADEPIKETHQSQRAKIENEDPDVDVWEPASPFSEEEEARIEGADVTVSVNSTISTEMQSFVADFREQIDSLRNTIESLRMQADRLDNRRKATREKIGGRINSIQTRIDDIRNGQ